jgi:hypothetical protein
MLFITIKRIPFGIITKNTNSFEKNKIGPGLNDFDDYPDGYSAGLSHPG